MIRSACSAALCQEPMPDAHKQASRDLSPFNELYRRDLWSAQHIYSWLSGGQLGCSNTFSDALMSTAWDNSTKGAVGLQGQLVRS